MSRYKTTVPVTGTCQDCDEDGAAPVTVDTAAGVAAWTCPNCDRTQGPPVDDREPADDQDRVACWRCGYDRLTFESCPECGGSCKPRTRREQREERR